MRYRILGRSGLRVSELCLGTMTFGTDWGWGAEAGECRAMLDLYLSRGGNFIDTACNYTNGASETILGELLKGCRDEVVLATKYTLTARPADPNAGGNHRKNLRQSVEGSLRRLATDRVDLLWLHMWDGTTPVDEVVRALDDLVRAGTILHFGMSDTPAWVVARAAAIAELRGWARCCAVQAQYALADRSVERDLLPMAQAHGMPLLAWGALAGGILTGKYATRGEPRRYRDHQPSERRTALVNEIVAVARDSGLTAAQVALGWLRAPSRRSSVIPILGARTVAQLAENLAVLDADLSDDALAKLDAASQIDLGFPRAFLSDPEVVELIFGQTRDALDMEPVV